jgi:hypothetical protein
VPSLVFCTGFEAGVNPTTQTSGGAGGQAMWNTVTGAPTVDSTVKRSGGWSLMCSPSNAQHRVTRNLVGSPTVVVLRFYFYVATLPGSTQTVARIVAAAGSSAQIDLSTTGNLRARWTGNTNGPTHAITTGQWYRVEMRANLAGGGTKTLDWSIDGVAKTPDTIAESDSSAANWFLGNASNATYTYYFDDVAVSVTSGDYPLGAGFVETLRPDSMSVAGAGVNFATDAGVVPTTADWARLDDDPLGGTSDFVRQSVLDATGSVFVEVGFADNTRTENINGVQAIMQFRNQSGTGTNTAKTFVRANTVDTYLFGSAAAASSIGTIAVSYKTMQVDIGSASWSDSILDGVVARFGFSTDVTPSPLWDAFLLEVDYAETVVSEDHSGSTSTGASVTVTASGHKNAAGTTSAAVEAAASADGQTARSGVTSASVEVDPSVVGSKAAPGATGSAVTVDPSANGSKHSQGAVSAGVEVSTSASGTSGAPKAGSVSTEVLVAVTVSGRKNAAGSVSASTTDAVAVSGWRAAFSSVHETVAVTSSTTAGSGARSGSTSTNVVTAASASGTANRAGTIAAAVMVTVRIRQHPTAYATSTIRPQLTAASTRADPHADAVRPPAAIATEVP